MKKAFSLIELVVTIVVVAIVSLAVPNVIKQISTSNARSLTQESILNAKTYLGLIMQSLYSCEGLNSNSTREGKIPFLYRNGQYGNHTNYADAIGIRRDDIRLGHIVTSLNNMSTVCNGITNATIIDQYNGTVQDIPVGNGIERDFIVDAVYTTQVSTRDTDSTIRLGEIFNFGIGANQFDNFNDVKIVKVNVATNGASQERTQINLYGFTFNLGTPPQYRTISTWN